MSELKPYPTYKDSGIEWLGEVPEGWELRPAVTLADVLTPTTDKKSYDDQDAVQLCNYTDVYYGDQIVASPSYMVATASIEQRRRYAVTAGDVPFTKDSETSDDIGISAFVPADLPGVVYGYHLGVYRPNDKRYSRFLKYVLDSAYAKTDFEVKTPGVTRVGLSQATVRYFRVPTPAPKDAQAIADFLDRETAEIDRFVQTSEQLIELLNERRAAVISAPFDRAVGTGQRFKFSFREMDVRAGTLAEKLPLMSVSISWGVQRRSEALGEEPSASDLSHYKVCWPGNIVLNRMRAFQGALGLASESGLVSPDYAVLSLESSLLPEWVSALMKSRQFVNEMTLRLKGIGSTETGAVRTPRINVADLGDIKVTIPSFTEQQAIADHLDRETARIDKAITEARKGIELAKERRQALISAAVTGKIDVRGAV